MSIAGADLSSKFALDVQSVNALKLEAKQSSPEALKAAARQFEAVFMNMLMKSMREATPQDGMFDSEQTKMYTSMLDQQLTQNLASRGVGLADMMVRQLSTALSAQTPAGEPAGEAFPLNPAAGAAAPATQASPRAGDAPAHVQSFVNRLLPEAEAASASSGIPARYMLGQAALETGWGRTEIRGADGQNSHNLFGIKAGAGWKGRTVDIVTTEYVNGTPQKQVDHFRAYDSYADAFRDYASLLKTNARYQNVIGASDAAGFAHGLQRAGYATDPAYANKLMGAIRLVETA